MKKTGSAGNQIVWFFGLDGEAIVAKASNEALDYLRDVYEM